MRATTGEFTDAVQMAKNDAARIKASGKKEPPRRWFIQLAPYSIRYFKNKERYLVALGRLNENEIIRHGKL